MGDDGSPPESQIQRHVRGASLVSIETTKVSRLVQERAADVCAAMNVLATCCLSLMSCISRVEL